METEYQKFFGLYSFFNDTFQFPKRSKFISISQNPRLVNKEINYIYNLKNGIGSFIMSHLSSYKFDDIYYKDIISFDFKSSSNCNDTDLLVIQQFINETYLVDSKQESIDWLKLNLLRRMKKRGYSDDISKMYINKYSNLSNTILSLNKDKLNKNQVKDLEKQNKRTCNNFHNNPPQIDEEDIEESKRESMKTKILLEDTLILDGEKQFILSTNDETHKYKLNSKAIINPWISDIKLGYFSWNMIINKTTISCFLNPEHETSKWLFPIRLILKYNPNELFFEHIFDLLSDTSKMLYMGFFLIRYVLTEEQIPEGIPEDCKHSFSFSGSLPHRSKEQYYVMFVFKQLETSYKPYEYIIVNFRCNKIAWGDVGELTKILSSEIRQINCIYVHNKINLFLLVKKGSNHNSINQICNSQYNEVNNINTHTLKSTSKCFEAWLHSDTFNLLKSNNLLPHTDDNGLHVLISNKSLEEINTKLSKNIYQLNDNFTNYIDINDEYILLECHFRWDNDFDDSKKQRFLLKHNKMDEEVRKNYKSNFCISDTCLKTLDDRRFYSLSILFNKKEDERIIIDPENILEISFEDIYKQLIKQDGGNIKKNNLLNKISKFNKLVSNNKDIPSSTIFNINSKIYQFIFYQSNKILLLGEEYKNMTNFITIPGIFSTICIPLIKLNKFLIIAHNISFIDKICTIFKNIDITFLVINNYEINSYILLKEKYNFINIYFLGIKCNLTTLDTIKQICNNNIYNTIIIDFGYHNYYFESIILALILSKYYLDKNGTLIYYTLLPNKINNYYYLHNILFNNFILHNINDLNVYFTVINIPSLIVYNTFINNIDNQLEKILLLLLDDTNYNVIIDKFVNKKNKFFKFMIKKYNNIIFNTKEYLNFIKYNNIQSGGYHKVAIKSISHNYPVLIDDLTNSSKFNGDAKDMPPICHWGQRKLLLSEIQFFTNIFNKINSYNNYIVVYIGSADGTHLPILFKLFPDLEWLLYDPNPFNPLIKKYNKVKIFNQFFLDTTIPHVIKNSNNKKILFISDIRVTTKDEQVMNDMINQARWGTLLKADFMLLKFRLPYNEPNSFIPKNITDLKLDKTINYISNPHFIANHTIYLKGKIYLQLYHPQYSTELRLFVEKTNNSYELDNYNYTDIENKIFNYNSEVRPFFINVKEYDFLNIIPGFDISIENIMEYHIIFNYYKIVKNIDNKNIIIKKLYDINSFLEKLTNKSIIDCGLNTIESTKFNVQKKDRVLKINLWKKISKINLVLNAKTQLKYIIKNGKKLIGSKRTNKAINKLNNIINKNKINLFVKLT